VEVSGHLYRSAPNKWQSCSADDRTVLSNLTMDQAALRTLVSLLWDGGCELRLLQGGDPASRRP
jgi:hypothetical protein